MAKVAVHTIDVRSRYSVAVTSCQMRIDLKNPNLLRGSKSLTVVEVKSVLWRPAIFIIAMLSDCAITCPFNRSAVLKFIVHGTRQ